MVLDSYCCSLHLAFLVLFLDACILFPILSFRFKSISLLPFRSLSVSGLALFFLTNKKSAKSFETLASNYALKIGARQNNAWFIYPETIFISMVPKRWELPWQLRRRLPCGKKRRKGNIQGSLSKDSQEFQSSEIRSLSKIPNIFLDA